MIRLRLALWLLRLTVRLDDWASQVLGPYIARYCEEHGGHQWRPDLLWQAKWQTCRVCRVSRKGQP